MVKKKEKGFFKGLKKVGREVSKGAQGYVKDYQEYKSKEPERLDKQIEVEKKRLELAQIRAKKSKLKNKSKYRDPFESTFRI